MADWIFSVGGGPPALVSVGLAPRPVEMTFATVLDVLAHIGAGNELPTRQIDARLRAGAQAEGWPRSYTRLHSAPHFKAYRGRRYDAYKTAALAIAAGTATPPQVALAAGLSGEISASRVIVPKGQVVLHGRSDRLPSMRASYDAFLSTTLSPFVAQLSAERRRGQLGGRSTIYVLTLARDLPAMWGHVGRSAEWELLFNAGLTVRATASSSAGAFDVVEAELG